MQDGLYPYLVVEKRNNDFVFINIADLDILKGQAYTNLFYLDSLLREFTEEEIKESIIRANIVSDVDVMSKRLLIKYGNYKLPVLTKEIADSLDLYGFIRDNFEDKTMKNIISNKITAIVKNKEKSQFFKDIMDYDTAENLIHSLNYLSYTELRELYFYLHNYLAKKQEIVDNDNSRIVKEREKNND